MKKFSMLLPVFLFAFISASYAQSLADLAKQEKERRQEVKENRVITNDDVAKFKSEPQTPAAQADQSATRPEKAADVEVGKPKTDNTDSDDPTDFQGRTESYWRKTMADARQKVKDLTNESNAIVLKINDLQNRFYSMDDPIRREDLQREVQKSYYEQDLNKQNLEKAKSALQDLENEARKSGALPGWLGSDTP
ncbi:MAG TPA: hypothetical protein VMG30_12260 [Acidobacteriota bacterium]|nr:hypothetical protein [Acidobacteriota bacterium]